MPDEALLGARIFAFNRNAKTPPPAGHGPLGASLGQGFDNCFDDFLGAMRGAKRYRRTGIGPYNGAWFSNHFYRAQRAVVFGNGRIEQESKRHGHRRLGIGMRRVFYKAGDFRIRLTQIDLQSACAFSDFGADGDVAVAATVIVEQSFTVVDAVLPVGDNRARLFFRCVQNQCGCLADDFSAGFFEQAMEALRA